MSVSRSTFKPAVALFGATVVTAAMLATTLLITPARAAETRSVSVQFADLDLATESGRVVLQRRIVQAAEAACAPADTPAVRLHKAYANCVNAARADAVRQSEAVVAAVRTGKNIAANTGAAPARN